MHVTSVEGLSLLPPPPPLHQQPKNKPPVSRQPRPAPFPVGAGPYATSRVGAPTSICFWTVT